MSQIPYRVHWLNCYTLTNIKVSATNSFMQYRKKYTQSNLQIKDQKLYLHIEVEEMFQALQSWPLQTESMKKSKLDSSIIYSVGLKTNSLSQPNLKRRVDPRAPLLPTQTNLNSAVSVKQVLTCSKNLEMLLLMCGNAKTQCDRISIQ